MARIIGTKSNNSGGVATLETSLARVENLTGDMLLMICSVTLATPPTVTTPAGWTLQRTDLNSNIRSYIFYKETTGDEETFPVLTLSTAGNWTIQGFSIRGVDFSGGPIGNISVSAATASANATGPTITTSADDSVIINAYSRARRTIDGYTSSVSSEVLLPESSSSTGAETTDIDIHCAAVKAFQTTSGEIEGGIVWESASGGGNNILYCMEILTDGTNTALYLDNYPIKNITASAIVANDDWRDIIMDTGVSFVDGSALSEYSFDATAVDTGADSIPITSHGIKQVRVVRADANGNTLPTGINDGQYYYVTVVDSNNIKLKDATPHHTGTSQWYPNPSDIDITAIGSGTCKFIDCGIIWNEMDSVGVFDRPPNTGAFAPAAINYFGSGVKFTSSRDMSDETISTLVTPGSASPPIDGLFIFIDSSGNFRTYRTYQEGDTRVGSVYTQINLNNESFLTESGALDKSSIDYVIFLYNASVAGFRPSITVLTPLRTMEDPIVIGGDSGYEASLADIYREINYYTANTSINASGNQFTFRSGLVFGNGEGSGNGQINALFDLKSLAFADISNRVNSRTNYAKEYSLIININPDSSVKFLSNAISSVDNFNFTIDADNPSASSVLLAGSTLINATVTLTANQDITGVAFVGGEGVFHNDAVLTNCTFQDIDRSEGYLILSETHNLTNPEFVTETPADYAIEIDSAGTYDISGFTFDGFTKEINVTETTGTVTIQLGAGQDEPSYDSDGATVEFETTPATYTLKFPNIIDGSRFQIYNVTQDTELTNALVTGGSGIDEDYTGGTDFDADDEGRYRITYQSGTTCKISIDGSFTFQGVTTTNSIPISQENDSIYALAAIDGSSVTEFSWDSGNVEVDINDADNTTTIQRFAAWFCYFLTTATGIDEAYDGIDWRTVNEIKINNSIADITLDNTKATALLLTGGRLFRDDGATIISSSSNSIQVDYSPVYQIETGVSGLTTAEAAKLNSLGTPAETADAVWDEAISGHLSAGTTGETLNNASAPTESEMYTYFTSSSRQDTFKADVSGLASQSSVDTIDGIVDAILADTNELQINQGNWLTATGFATSSQATTIQSTIDALNNISTSDLATALNNYDGPTKAELDSAQSSIESAISALNNLSAAQVNAEVDTALSDYDAPTKVELDTAQSSIESAISALNDLDASGVWDYLLAETTVSDSMKDAIEKIRTNANLIPALL